MFSRYNVFYKPNHSRWLPVSHWLKCYFYQELKSPKPVLPLDFLAVVTPLVDGPLSSAAAGRFLQNKHWKHLVINVPICLGITVLSSSLGLNLTN